MNFRSTRQVSIPALLLATSFPLFAGEAYYTGFENFTVGDDKIIGTESWVGTYGGSRMHGIMSESQHGVPSIGKAAFLGGYATTVTRTGTVPTSVYVRKPVSLDPVALNQEVATFSVVFGIKDSITTTRRDNFEFLVYNQGNALLAGLQFDNTTLDPTNLKPRRLIYRLSWNGSEFQYYFTNYNFLPETLETLQFRINYRTNLWTASLSDVPIFQDIPFYTGASPRNFGSVMVKMVVTNFNSTSILPGDNYMLFDDYTVRTDALTTSAVVSKTPAGAASLAWNEEAAYKYQVEHSSDCKTWKTDLPASSHTATLTQTATFVDPTIPVPANRFYRIRRTYP